jgi:hypothetical protein
MSIIIITITINIIITVTIIVVIVVVVVVVLLIIIYTINLFMVRPRSCRVIYYCDTPALGIRHQLFDRVIKQNIMLLSIQNPH